MRHVKVGGALYFQRHSFWLFICTLVICCPVNVCQADTTNIEKPPVEAADNDKLANAVNALTVESFQDKEQAINNLAKIVDPRVMTIMQTMLDGNLYYHKNDKRVVYIKEEQGAYRTTDVLSSQDMGTVAKQELNKISVNNHLRTVLRGAISRLNLFNKDPAVRLVAAKEIAKDINPDTAALLHTALDKEDNKKVRETIESIVLLLEVDSDDKNTRLHAIKGLSRNLTPEVRNRIVALLEKNSNGEFIEHDIEIRGAASAALDSIDRRLDFYGFIENVFFGLSLGSVLLLIAIGLAITFGVMGVINMAHGELMMLGAYTTYLVQTMMPDHIDMSLFVAIPAAFIVAGMFGIAIERGVIRFLYGRPLETLLATFGISLILQQMVRTIFSPLNRSVFTPSWMSGSLDINGALSLTYNRLYIIFFALLVFALLQLILKKTSLGLQVRAVSQNRAMAKAMGIRTEWVDAMTFGLGSGIAGVAGVALSQLTNVGPNLGQSYIIDSFMVVVFGGVGNLWGTLIGGTTLGIASKFLEPWAGAVLAKILILICIILFIQKRPRGLFPQKGRAAEN